MIAIFIGLVIAGIYLPWFTVSKTLSSGDWPYLFKETITSLPAFVGEQSLWLDTYYHLTAKLGVQVLHLPWEIAEKLFWYYPFLVLALLFSWLLAYSYFDHVHQVSLRRSLAALGSLIYATNSYILMIVGGGQMGVAMAFAFAPGVFWAFLRLFRDQRVSFLRLVFTVLVSSLQLMFDPRLFILTIFGMLWMVYVQNGFVDRRSLISIGGKILLIVFAAVCLNLFWILPNLSSYKSFYADATQGLGVLSYFSFAKFSNSIALLHPNWPENVFGKIYFMKPQFLILPMLAFGSLFFVQHMQKKKGNATATVGFALLALFGAFLAKGTNEPFGWIYTLLARIPGFMIFRDPTKFYVLIALSYSVLIPLMLYQIGKKLDIRFHASTYLALYSFLLVWGILHRQAFLGGLTGTFQPHTVPTEYIRLKDYFAGQRRDFSVLWLPRRQRFGYYSTTQQAINSQDVLADVPAWDLASQVASEGGRMMLRSEHVQYLVIPYDSEQEIFLTNRTFDAEKRKEWERAFDMMQWLTKLSIPGITEKITVYKVKE